MIGPERSTKRLPLLLGGVSVLVLAGVAGCSTTGKGKKETMTAPPTSTPNYTPPQTPSSGDYTVSPAPTGDYIATTLAVGEEDGSGPFPVEPDGGIGDGAGPIPDGTVTTLAIGEEDGAYTPPSYDGGTVTTLAIGEEDGGVTIPVEPDGGIGDGAGPIPGTTYAPTTIDSYSSTTVTETYTAPMSGAYTITPTETYTAPAGTPILGGS